QTLYIRGLSGGTTNMIVQGRSGACRVIDVAGGADAGGLQAALQQLMQHPAHLEAKAKQARWLDGYRVVISKVLREYGDGKLTQPHAGQSA
ncbi:hypothetical protein NO135_21215, partial [Clostridioides difficile]|nr:hypothetical protein [Clostridioides difficile]